MAASGARLIQISTDRIRPAERFAYWRDVALVRSEPDLPTGEDRVAFHGKQRVLSGAGTRLMDRRTSPIILRRTPRRCRADGGDEVQLTVTLEADSDAGVMHPDGTEVRVGASDLVLMDLAQPLTGQHGTCRELVLLLPRRAVAGALGIDPGKIGVRTFRASPRIRLVQDQLRLVANTMPELDSTTAQAALDATVSLALAVLCMETAELLREPAAHSAGLFAAAQRYIDLHFADPALRPDTIAAALRCSRTQLYRVFSEHQLAVMDYVQAVRLRRARQMLAAPAMTACSIAEISHLCGFDDPSGFSRSFRQRFGCTPREARRGALPG